MAKTSHSSSSTRRDEHGRYRSREAGGSTTSRSLKSRRGENEGAKSGRSRRGSSEPMNAGHRSSSARGGGPSIRDREPEPRDRPRRGEDTRWSDESNYHADDYLRGRPSRHDDDFHAGRRREADDRFPADQGRYEDQRGRYGTPERDPRGWDESERRTARGGGYGGQGGASAQSGSFSRRERTYDEARRDSSTHDRDHEVQPRGRSRYDDEHRYESQRPRRDYYEDDRRDFGSSWRPENLRDEREYRGEHEFQGGRSFSRRDESRPYQEYDEDRRSAFGRRHPDDDLPEDGREWRREEHGDERSGRSAFRGSSAYEGAGDFEDDREFRNGGRSDYENPDDRFESGRSYAAHEADDRHRGAARRGRSDSRRY